MDDSKLFSVQSEYHVVILLLVGKLGPFGMRLHNELAKYFHAY